ncbi:MAG: hypothetical protein IIY34_06610, partial [Clostridia bacterium]|nr:hypothetical protein [Clostridia bacterium]
MHVYHIKDPEGYYCTWDRQLKKPVRIVDEEGHGYTDYTAMTTEQQNNLASFTTGIYGTISEIPVGYTVEIRDVLAGTKFRAVERPDEIPDGYSFQKYIYNGTVSGNTAYEGIADTVTADTNPNVVVCNLKGWGLRVHKVWRDADYMSNRDPAYFAVFTTNGDLVPGCVRRISYSAKPQTMYWYYDHLPVAGTTGVQDYFIREVAVSASEPTVSADGVVTNYADVTALEGGDETELYGTPKGETGRSRFTYTVNYDGGAISSESNVRVDTVTNDRPGIILKKQDWNGGPLAGAVFTLKDENDNTLGTFTSDEEGVITTAFLSGGKEYTLTETAAPAGYHGPEKDIKIMMNGSLTVSGPDEEYYTVTQANGTELASLTVKNRPYTLEAVKTDATTLEPLSGVVFALHRQVTVGDVTAIDLNPMPGYESLTTDENGLIPMIDGTLPAGAYELREKVPLEGYKPLGEYIRFTVSPTGDVTLDNAVEGVTIETGTAEDGTLEYVMTVNNIQNKKVSFKKVDITNV